MADLDNDGKISAWESNLCRICLVATMAVVFGDKVVNGV